MPVAQNSAAISGGRPGAPTTASARVTRRYEPTSFTAVFSIARGVCWRKIFWLISEIFERSRSVSAVYTPVRLVAEAGSSATGGAVTGFDTTSGSALGFGAPSGHQFAA